MNINTHAYSFVLVVCSLLCLRHARAGVVVNPAPAQCPGAADPSCRAFSFLEILVTDGSCRGRASADCRAVSESQDVFRQAFVEWFAEDPCDSGYVNTTATAVARAVAKVWSNAAAKVTCEGTGGFACGWSITGGTSFAQSFAEALAQAAADAGALESVQGFCFADVRSLTPIIAEAAGQAQSRACFHGQDAEDFESSYVEVVSEGVATALASAAASSCDGDGQSNAMSKCGGDGNSTVSESIAVKGDVCGGVSNIKPCEGPGKYMCCASNFENSLCICQKCGGPWVRRRKGSSSRSTFMKKSGELCYCKNDADEIPTIFENVPDIEGSTEAEVTAESLDDLEEILDADLPLSTAIGPEEEAPIEEQAISDRISQILDKKKGPRCTGARDISCRAFAFLEILVTAGRCTGTASADCKAVRESQNEFEQSFDDWFGKKGVCDQGQAEATATAVAKAIAKVWANAAVKVNCEGSGFACGWSISNGETWAVGFAEAIAQAAADAGEGLTGEVEGFCYADLRSISVVLARAAAEAQAKVCSTGGEQEDFENSYVAAVEVGVATALARASAQACSDDDGLIASSECVGDASEGSETEASNAGDTCAGVATASPCAGSGKTMCCDDTFKRTLCTCNQVGCTNGPWVRRTVYDTQGRTMRTFEDREANVCYCLKGAPE